MMERFLNVQPEEFDLRQRKVLFFFFFFFFSFLFHLNFLLIEGDEIDQEPLAEFNDQFESSTDFEGLLCASDQEYEALNEDSDAEGYLSLLSSSTPKLGLDFVLVQAISLRAEKSGFLILERMHCMTWQTWLWARPLLLSCSIPWGTNFLHPLFKTWSNCFASSYPSTT